MLYFHKPLITLIKTILEGKKILFFLAIITAISLGFLLYNNAISYIKTNASYPVCLLHKIQKGFEN